MEFLDEFYTNITTENLRDFLLFLFSISVLLFFFIIYLLLKNYVATKHIQLQIKRFNLDEKSSGTLTKKLYSVENKLLKYGLLDPRLKPLERILDAYAVTVTDMNGIITYANDGFCKASGFSKDELVGSPHSMISSGIHSKEFWSEMWDTVNDSRVWHKEVINRRKNGDLYWLDTIIIPLSLITEKDSGYISLRTDITAIRQANQALSEEVAKKNCKIDAVEKILLQSEKMASMGILAAGVAHEINNPVSYVASNTVKLQESIELLSPIVIAALQIANDPETPPPIKEKISEASPDLEEAQYLINDAKSMLSETLDGVTRIKKIVSDLKSFTHSGKEAFSPADIHKCIESALNLANNEIKYKAKVKKQFGKLPPVTCIESQINQVLLNMIVNASHAVEKNGEISIRTENCPNGFVRISISDNGCGIKQEDLSNIFDLFYTTKPAGKGTGIGLSISRDIISKHHGSIEVDSTPGSGTTFHITLPVSHAGLQRLAS